MREAGLLPDQRDGEFALANAQYIVAGIENNSLRLQIEASNAPATENEIDESHHIQPSRNDSKIGLHCEDNWDQDDGKRCCG